LRRLFELREEVQEFLAQKKSLLASHLANSDWLARLAYLVDLFNELNIVNLSLQGIDSNVFRNVDKIHAFMMKLQHWKFGVSQGRYDMFSCLNGLLCDNKSSEVSM